MPLLEKQEQLCGTKEVERPEEIELGFSFVDETSPEAKDEGYWERKDLRCPNEEDVLAIARRWGVAPSFESNQYEPGVRVLGILKQSG